MLQDMFVTDDKEMSLQKGSFYFIHRTKQKRNDYSNFSTVMIMTFQHNQGDEIRCP